MAMLVEPTDQDGRLMDDGLPALVGGVHNLRQGQQAKACLTMLFRNSSPTGLVVRDRDIVGKAMLIRTGKVDKEWKREVEKAIPAHILRAGIGAALNNVNVTKKGKPDIKGPITPPGGTSSPSSSTSTTTRSSTNTPKPADAEQWLDLQFSARSFSTSVVFIDKRQCP